MTIYDESGSSIVLKKGRLIEIDCDVLKINAAAKVDISSPLDLKPIKVFTAQGQINGNEWYGCVCVCSGASFTGNVQQSGGRLLRPTATWRLVQFRYGTTNIFAISERQNQ